jgi:selenocysteine-specific elongation factor
MVEAVASAEDPRMMAVVGSGAAEVRRHVGGTLAVAERHATSRLDAVVGAGRLARDGDRVHLPGRQPVKPAPELVAAMDRLVAILEAVAPPPLSAAAREAGCPPAAIAALERSNRIVRLDDDLAWAFPTYRDLAGRAVAMAAVEPLTPAAYRDATGTSRKYVLAILEDLDRRAILRRTPAGHVPGPRASLART